MRTLSPGIHILIDLPGPSNPSIPYVRTILFDSRDVRLDHDGSSTRYGAVTSLLGCSFAQVSLGGSSLLSTAERHMLAGLTALIVLDRSTVIVSFIAIQTLGQVVSSSHISFHGGSA